MKLTRVKETKRKSSIIEVTGKVILGSIAVILLVLLSYAIVTGNNVISGDYKLSVIIGVLIIVGLLMIVYSSIKNFFGKV